MTSDPAPTQPRYAARSAAPHPDQSLHLDQSRHPDQSPTLRRILAIDDEIAALDRVQPRSRYLLYGSALLAAVLLWGVTLVAAGSSAAEPLLRVILFVTVPGAVFAGQIARNRYRRHRLELELDELTGEPGPYGRNEARGREGGVATTLEEGR
jgi:hypothetical protein